MRWYIPYLVHEVHTAHRAISRGSRDAVAFQNSTSRPRLGHCTQHCVYTVSTIILHALGCKKWVGLAGLRAPLTLTMRRTLDRFLAVSSQFYSFPSALMARSCCRESSGIPAPTGELSVGCIDLMHKVQLYIANSQW